MQELTPILGIFFTRKEHEIVWAPSVLHAVLAGLYREAHAIGPDIFQGSQWESVLRDIAARLAAQAAEAEYDIESGPWKLLREAVEWNHGIILYTVAIEQLMSSAPAMKLPEWLIEPFMASVTRFELLLGLLVRGGQHHYAGELLLRFSGEAPSNSVQQLHSHAPALIRELLQVLNSNGDDVSAPLRKVFGHAQ